MEPITHQRDTLSPARLTSYSHAGYVFDVTDTGPIDGPIVVLLHGFPQSSHAWQPTADILNKRGYRTVAPDQRGYSPGARPWSRFAYRTSALVDDVIALIDALGGAPVHVVGHDWGAMVAWQLAANHPDRVHTLTAVAVPHPAAFLRTVITTDQARRSWYMAAFQIPWIPEAVLTRLPKFTARVLTGTGMNTRQLTDARALIIDTDALTPSLHWYRAMAFITPNALLRKVTVPTTYAWGLDDTVVCRRSGELTARYVAAPYQFESVPNAGHWIPEEQPQRLADIICTRATT